MFSLLHCSHGRGLETRDRAVQIHRAMPHWPHEVSQSQWFLQGFQFMGWAEALPFASDSALLCTELSKASKDALEYLRKATLCSIRIARKVPDLAENFMGLDASLLKEKHHGSLYLQFSYAQNYAKQAKML
ncbi:putative sucrose-phosphatase 2 [Zea mays]|uniref:Putative sucrose-phosphatase 2 n=1 Tax=Zea mays TaxID=4577 RepID=A0A1D6LFJ0_MAIZE|nr:putative sucrose-phosphatase 2 [Zea mays]AQK78721.1 putative sucrose-phosphatase 2 [Zea mays]AQK78730.1 putative sucrose-phosphatase 2 [Zea mays]AQK78800.1 putative sucrose-phosphatase 2 [Zea mays]AQK78823.1 putative sucrose-phosphatase 2 [Zea mays]